jgi:tRNA pseudouridine38-40 synthase
MRQSKIIVDYDGTDFCGWQVQPHGRSVQAELEAALLRLTGETIRVGGAGRTDAGVHARGQTAAFLTAAPIPIANFAAALNSRLPKDIAARSAEEAAENFHPRYDAKMKWYRYTLFCSPMRPALERRYVWHLKFPLDFSAMTAAAAQFIGRRDFTSFSNQDRAGEDNVREVTKCALTRSGEKVFIDVEGRSFLYNMVRNIVGTLVDVGCGRFAPTAIPEIFAARNRAAAGQGAPACGLCLERIDY